MFIVFIICLFSNTMLELMYKWGIDERYDTYSPKWFPTWCKLCFFFWCAMFSNIYLQINSIVEPHVMVRIIVMSLAETFLSLAINKIYKMI